MIARNPTTKARQRGPLSFCGARWGAASASFQGHRCADHEERQADLAIGRIVYLQIDGQEILDYRGRSTNTFCPTGNQPPFPKYRMVAFREWFFLQERSLVDPAVVASYERAFQQGLEGLIARTRDPALRQAFSAMRSFGFAAYILGSLARNGVQYQFDIEDCLQRIVFRMLSSVGERGMPHSGLFDLDLNRAYDLARGNPLEARFKTYLAMELRNITAGRIPAVRLTQRQGSLSIGYGREQGTVSPDEIPGRAVGGEQEMLDDLIALLRRRSTPQMPLVDLFHSMLAGEGMKSQRARFGYDRADEGRQVIVQIVRQYAYQTQNWHLVQLLDKFLNPDAARPDPRRPAPPPKPKYPPDEQDYRSIVDVLERNGRQANLAQFGHYRRRWLERAPRDPSSVYPNRLADVLARMVQDGVLQKQGARYIPGANYSRYLVSPEPVAVA